MVTHDDYDGQLFCQTIDENMALIREQNIVQKDILIEEYTTIKNNAKKIEEMLINMKKQGMNIPEQLDQTYGIILHDFIMDDPLRIMHIEDVKYLRTQIKPWSQRLKSIRKSLDKIPLLNELTKDNQLNIIVGANGSGKSSLVDYLKDSMLINLSVIPAYRNLFFNSNNYNAEMLKSTSAHIMSNLQNTRAKSYEKDQDTFSIAVYALVNEYVDYLSKKNEDDNYEGTDILKKLNSIYMDILPHIKFLPVVIDRILTPQSQLTKNEYQISELSDGEKSVLYFISLLLLTDDKSYIVVDEPETYMHTALAIKLWNTLLKEKPDCKFILISHNIDFIQSLTGAQIKWLKKYERPESWEFQNIEGIQLPQDLVLKIMGSKKDVLFIEGTSHGSLDYRIYSELFGEIYNIQPVNGHREVKKYTEAYNKTGVFGNSAKGIIDRDSWDANEIEALERKEVFVLPTNEIEMLLFTDEVVEAVLLAHCYEEDELKNINNQFKKHLFERINMRKEQIIMNHLKNKIDHYLEKQKIEDSKTLESLKQSFAKLINISIDTEYDKLLLEINDIITQQDYKRALEICNLKTEITKGLADKYLVPGYLDFAERLIKKDVVLRNKLKESHFERIERGVQVLEVP